MSYQQSPYTVAYASPNMPPVYRPTEGRGRLLRVLLFVMIACELLGGAVAVYELTLPAGFGQSDDDVSLGYALTLLGYGLLYVAAFLTTAIVFCMWMYRAHANLPALWVQGLDYTPGWAAGAWFVPILNLFRPFQIMREIWKASDPASVGGQADQWRQAKDPAILGWWWGAWLIANFLGQASMRMALRDDPDMQRFSSVLDLINCPISLAGAWLAIQIVAAIDRMQAERAVALSQYAAAYYAQQQQQQYAATAAHSTALPPIPVE